MNSIPKHLKTRRHACDPDWGRGPKKAHKAIELVLLEKPPVFTLKIDDVSIMIIAVE